MRLTARQGFTIIELLIVIAIIGILATLLLTAVSASRRKANDNSVRTSVRQMRVLVEEVYNTQGGSYIDWSQNAEVTQEVAILKAEIDSSNGLTDSTIIREAQEKEFCISAPLNDPTNHYCTDVTGFFGVVTSQCADFAIDDEDPLRCAV